MLPIMKLYIVILMLFEINDINLEPIANPTILITYMYIISNLI